MGITTPEPLDYTSVMARGKSLGWVVGYVALLGLGLYHGLYGLRSILCEIVHPGKERLLTWAIIGIGLVAFAFGSYVVIMSYAMEGI
nr:hypothetical protein [Thermanaeromonas sp.]